MFDTIWKDAPSVLKECILKDAQVKDRMQDLLHAYGPLLIPKEELEATLVGGDKPLVKATAEPSTKGSGLKCGALICTAGGIPHAGPASKDFRVVMVFAAAAASPDKESL